MIDKKITFFLSRLTKQPNFHVNLFMIRHKDIGPNRPPPQRISAEGRETLTSSYIPDSQVGSPLSIDPSTSSLKQLNIDDSLEQSQGATGSEIYSHKTSSGLSIPEPSSVKKQGFHLSKEERQTKKVVNQFVNGIMKKVIREGNRTLPSLNNVENAVIDNAKIWAYALDPFNIDKKLEKQKTITKLPPKIEDAMRKNWAARVGLFRTAGFTLRTTPTTRLEDDKLFFQSVLEIACQILAGAKTLPAVPNVDENGLKGANVKIDLRGPKANLRVLTGWSYRPLTAGGKTDIPRLITIIPLSVLSPGEKETT